MLLLSCWLENVLHPRFHADPCQSAAQTPSPFVMPVAAQLLGETWPGGKQLFISLRPVVDRPRLHKAACLREGDSSQV